MTFKAKNEFWKLRLTHGRDLIFKDVDELARKVIEYIEMCKSNPIKTEVATSRGIVERNVERPITVLGICNYLGINFSTWKEYKERTDFTKFITQVEDLIKDHKFTYATIGEFSATIIARDLGLADKKDITGAQPVVIKSANHEEAEANREAFDNLE